MKLSEYLQRLDSHDVYDAENLGKDFKEKTGHDPCWPTHSSKDLAKAMRSRGVGGWVSNQLKVGASGYEIAESLARKYADYSSPYEGRGRRFRGAIEALAEKGL